MSDYKVTMRMGNDTCNTTTTVTADSAADAAIVADLKWTGITVRVLDVDLIPTDDDYCATCETLLDDDGTCTNCHY